MGIKRGSIPDFKRANDSVRREVIFIILSLHFLYLRNYFS